MSCPYPNQRRPMAGRAQAQQGVALFIVMMLVLLTTLLVLWASRSALLHEIVTGNDADYQRAFEAAQAMVRDAELDILGINASGSVIPRCGAPGALGAGRCRPQPLSANMNVGSSPASVYFPTSESLEDEDGGDLRDLERKMVALRGAAGGCAAAICAGGITRLPESGGATQPFWANSALLNTMKSAAAYYGQFTNAQAGAEGQSNPLLQGGGSGSQRAWYWVEPLLFEASMASAAASRFSPRGMLVGNAPGVVFRITAYVEGQKLGTQAVVQSIFVKQSLPSRS